MEEKLKQKNPKLHKYLFTVTTFSKLLAMTLFILLPFIGFYLGIKYQKAITKMNFIENSLIRTNQTSVEKKPRDKIITYTVIKGDTIQSIADKFTISTNTIKWENQLNSNILKEAQTLKIIPVTGVSYLVKRGNTIETVAVKFHTTKQKIIDYPFNNFSNPEKFTLIPDKILIIPDGIR